MDSQTKLKRVVIKEELVRLTGDHIKALILNQFLYWSERTKDFDKFIKEEKERYFPEDDDLNMDLTYGWIYKSADELSNELMLGLSPATMRRHLNKIVKTGYIDQRHNPKYKWDRTLQYRPNIIAIQADLEAMGLALDGYPLLQNASFKMKNGNVNLKNRKSKNEGAIPETTTETTTENMPQSGENDFPDLFGDQSPANEKPQNGKPELTEAEQAHLQTFGVLPDQINPDDKIYAIRQEIAADGWVIYGLDVEMGIAHFVKAVRVYHPKFIIPKDTSTRKRWYKDVGGHLQNYSLKDLANLYKRAIIKMRAADLDCFSPGSLTKWALPKVANSSSNSVKNHVYSPKLTEAQKTALAELTAQNK